MSCSGGCIWLVALCAFALNLIRLLSTIANVLVDGIIKVVKMVFGGGWLRRTLQYIITSPFTRPVSVLLYTAYRIWGVCEDDYPLGER